jgi:cytosine/adenosine deaminase-related metal-dependent hydrolase
MTIFEADWICPVAQRPIPNGTMAVRDGLIIDVGTNLAGLEHVRFRGCAIIPGFVNAHTHLELTVLRGFLEDLEFITWIRTLTATKQQRLSREELLISAELGAAEMLAAGVTCVGEVMDLGTSWQAMQAHNLQGIAFQEVFGPDPFHADDSMTGLIRKIESMRDQETETRRLGVSPHAPFTVSEKLFRMVHEYAENQQLRSTIHIAESADEDRFLRLGVGPFADRNRERGFEVCPQGCTGVAYLNRLGILGPSTLLIHAIRADDDDIETLSRTRTPVVHCPKSNAKLGHGIARIVEMQSKGVPLCLGTDSVASNNTVDMFEEMRSAIFMQRVRMTRYDALDAEGALRLATLGGAECLGLDRRLGSLEPGKRADFAVVDLNGVAVTPVYSPIDAMVFSASRGDIRATYIGGNLVRIDPSDLAREASRIARRLSSDSRR